MSQKHADTFVLTGEPITIGAVVAVANGQQVEVAPACLHRLADARVKLFHAIEAGEVVYGTTTGVGALREVQIDRINALDFNRQLILSHRVSHGDLAPRSVVRATMFCRAQGLALGGSGVRPIILQALIEALNADDIPSVRVIGSVGQGDLAPLAEIAEALIARSLRLEAREGLALVAANSFSLGWTVLALARTVRAIHGLEASTALTMEGLLFNPDTIDPAVFQARPSTGLKQSVLRLRTLLAGGTLLSHKEKPRLLHDPLCIRGAPQVHGCAHEAWRHSVDIVETELASVSDNPLLTPDGQLIAVGNFDSSGLTAALDYMRIALAQAITLCCERIQKLLSRQHSGLPTGLRAGDDTPQDGFAIFGHGAASLAAEARLLAQPVSLELPTSSIAESIEDRVTMSSLAARRLDEQAALAIRLAAVELICAAQAIDLRARSLSLGVGTLSLYKLVRSQVSTLREGDAPTTAIDSLVTEFEHSLSG